MKYPKYNEVMERNSMYGRDKSALGFPLSTNCCIQLQPLYPM
jgi:hypothetical protein